jgi:hypothetical protein
MSLRTSSLVSELVLTLIKHVIVYEGRKEDNVHDSWTLGLVYLKTKIMGCTNPCILQY